MILLVCQMALTTGQPTTMDTLLPIEVNVPVAFSAIERLSFYWGLWVCDLRMDSSGVNAQRDDEGEQTWYKTIQMHFHQLFTFIHNWSCFLCSHAHSRVWVSFRKSPAYHTNHDLG
jgi:hypothetical protein